MTDLLQQVVSEIQKLPADQRDAIAALILADLKDEQWDRLAEATRKEIAVGDAVPINDVFPVDQSQQ